MTSLVQDLRYALRQLRNAPGFALVVVFTLALAIGVSTAVFSVLDATVVRPLPYNDPDRIVQLNTRSPQGYTQPASWLQYVDWRRENRTLLALAGYQVSSANVESSSGTMAVRAVYGTDNFFDVFAVNPLLGRTFTAGEDSPGRNDVVVLSYDLWRRDFGGRVEVLGSALKVDGVVNTVIGVMPPGFRYPLGVVDAIYRPVHLPARVLTMRGSHFLPTLGRLRPGATLATAQADLSHVFDDLGRVYPDEAGRKVELLTLAHATLGSTAAPLRVLTLAVFGVLLIGCMNIAGLLMARGVRRERELSLRSAVGATRGRIVQQLLTEAAVLSLAGGVAGVVLAAGLLQMMRQLLIHSLARGGEAHLNLAVLAATFAVAVLSGLLAGVLPALQSSQVDPARTLRSGGSAGTNRGQSRVRSVLISGQVAIALMLLVCSGLLLRNLHSLRSTELGISTNNILTEEVFITSANYVGRDPLVNFYTPLLDEVRSIPGVQGAGIINVLPIQDWGNNGDMAIIGKPPAAPNEERLAEIRTLTPGAIEALGGRLIQGRMLQASDDHTSAFVATVNQAFLRKFFSPGEDAVGRQIDWGADHLRLTIVGVTSDMRQSLSQLPMAEMDISVGQIPTAFALDELTRMKIVVRTAGSIAPQSIAGPLQRAMHDVDASVPFRAPLTMNQIIGETLTFERLEGWLFGIFAALALLLSLIGIYGMVHHEVELQTRDIGVRMALGSTRGRVVRQILQRVTLLMAVGIGLGWMLTLAMQRALTSILVLHAAHDAALLGMLTAALAAVGVAASLLPARRAAGINPMIALRME